MESTAIEFAYAVYDRYVKSVRTSLDALGDDGVGLLPSEEIIGLGRGSPSVDFSGEMPSCARFTFTPSPCANV